MSRFTKLRARWLHSRGKAVSAYAPTLLLFRPRSGSIKWIPVFVGLLKRSPTGLLCAACADNNFHAERICDVRR